MEHLSVEVPPSLDDALCAYDHYQNGLFPDMVPVPRCEPLANSLPPTNTGGPIPLPDGNPPSFAASAASGQASSGLSADTVYITEKLSETFSDAIA